MKVLILGAKGMLGHALVEVYKEHDVIAWDQEELDIANKSKVREIIPETKADIIINAAAFTDVDACEEKRATAYRVNGEAVGYLALAADEMNIPIVHISTDYVFSGKKKEGYSEEDIPEPINSYGRSKLRGEQHLKVNAKQYYLIRTAWLFGPDGNNFVKTIAKLCKEKNQIEVVNDQFGNPTYSKDLAANIYRLVYEKPDFGIYHFTNSGVVSWYDFANEIVKLINPQCKVLPVDSDKNKKPAKRPAYSILLNNKFYKMRNWQDALRNYIYKIDEDNE
ncbi:dTDP-4-dehydrorhamnose reductase [Patescibacteria group bacterium]